MMIVTMNPCLSLSLDTKQQVMMKNKLTWNRFLFKLTPTQNTHGGCWQNLNLIDKYIILKNLKLLKNDSETGTIFLQPPFIS